MEFIAIILGGILGWQVGGFGPREVKAIAIVVCGWTAVTLAASLAELSPAFAGWLLLYHAAVVTAPYALGVLANRIARRRR